MHHCSNDLENKQRITLYAILLSIFTFFYILLPIYAFIEATFNFTIPIWVETPSIIGLYQLFIKIFDKYLWKYSFVEVIGLPKIPNLNGEWKVKIYSSFDNNVKDADIEIVHNYSHFSMILKTAESKSATTSAIFNLMNPIYKTISYSYLSKPITVTNDTMNIHEGTAILEISEDIKKLEGYYYAGRGRLTYGKIIMEKI